MEAKQNRKRAETLFVYLTKPERARLDKFCACVERPLSWVIRDALRVYLDAVEGDQDRLAAVRPVVRKLENVGKTLQCKRGRPPKKKAMSTN